MADRRSAGRGLWSALAGAVLRPRRTMAGLASERRLDLGLGAVLLYGALYTATAVILHLQDRRPVVEPVLPIPEDRYYGAQAAFTVPVVLAAWLVLTGTAWTTLRGLGHRSDLGRCAAVLGVSTSVPWIAGMWLPETAVAAFAPRYWGAPPGTPAVIAWIGSWYLWAVGAWAVGLSWIALRSGTGAGPVRSLVAAVIGVGSATGFQMVFVR